MNIWKINIPKSIIILTILAIVLNIFRVIIWNKFSFIWMIWNIFLAFVPFLISSLMLILLNEGKLNKVLFTIGVLIWIIFIPNSPYIITDFIHLGTTRSIPIVYDILLIFSSATVGLYLFFHSLFHIEQIIKSKHKKNTSLLIMIVFMILISFGVYLGRFLRFNSWDIFIDHSSLVNNIWEIISQAARHIEVYLYTGLFFFFLFLTYNAWKYSNSKQ
jgi:uncharacterized membrane protein